MCLIAEKQDALPKCNVLRGMCQHFYDVREAQEGGEIS